MPRKLQGRSILNKRNKLKRFQLEAVYLHTRLGSTEKQLQLSGQSRAFKNSRPPNFNTTLTLKKNLLQEGDKCFRLVTPVCSVCGDVKIRINGFKRVDVLDKRVSQKFRHKRISLVALQTLRR